MVIERRENELIKECVSSIQIELGDRLNVRDEGKKGQVDDNSIVVA